MNDTTTPNTRPARTPPNTPPTTLVGMDAHSKKIVLCLTHWQHGSDPVVLQTIATPLDALEVYVPTEEGTRMRDLFYGYAHTVETRDAYRQRIEQTVANTPDMLRVMQVLGIGVLCAFGLLVFIEDIERFENAKRLVSYFGFNPVVDTSGENTGTRRLSRFGQRTLKSMLVEAAHSALRHGNAPMHCWARRKIAAGKPRNVMLCALARKMVVQAWHILKGHPVPEREPSLSYRRKLAKLAAAVRKHSPAMLEDKTAIAFAARVCAVLYPIPPRSSESHTALREPLEPCILAPKP